MGGRGGQTATGGVTVSGGGAGFNPAPAPDAAGNPSTPSTPDGAGARIIVAAGEQDRERSIVSFTLGAALAGKPLALEDAEGKRLPLQVDAEGRAVFVLPALKAGAEATFTIKAAEPATAKVAAMRESDGVTITAGSRKVFRYQMQGKLPGGVGQAYLRGGYVHPIFTPAGALVSDDYPGDHRHHHGLWSAWASTTFEGRHIDFWNMGGGSAKVDFAELGGTWDGAVHGGLRSRQAHISLAGGAPKTALDEDWMLTVYHVADGEAAPPYFLFDLDSTQRAASAAPVMLDKYIYGGFALRGHASWGGAGGATFLTAEGRTRGNGDGTSTRWCHIGGRVAGNPVGYAALVHPGNFRAPQPVRINPTDPFFSIAPVASGGFTIEPGKPYVSRYRIVVSDGAADKSLLDRLWSDYARPPAVTVTMP